MMPSPPGDHKTGGLSAAANEVAGDTVPDAACSDVSLLLGISAGVSGALLGAWSRRRPPEPLREAVPRSSIAELCPGRFAVHGRIVPLETEPSAIDEARCVFVERVQTVPAGLARALEHARIAHRFFLEDETGRLEVDPERAHVEASTISDESGSISERRLRAGEEVELVCEVRASHRDGSTVALAPTYRDGAVRVEIDYDAPGSPPILRDAVDVRGLDLGARPPERAAAGAAGAALVGWGLALVLWAAAFAAP